MHKECQTLECTTHTQRILEFSRYPTSLVHCAHTHPYPSQTHTHTHTHMYTPHANHIPHVNHTRMHTPHTHIQCTPHTHTYNAHHTHTYNANTPHIYMHSPCTYHTQCTLTHTQYYIHSTHAYTFTLTPSPTCTTPPHTIILTMISCVECLLALIVSQHHWQPSQHTTLQPTTHTHAQTESHCHSAATKHINF